MIKNYKRSCGFTLVEILVAMVIGILVMSGAFALHSGTRSTQKMNEAQMDMAADARFAIEMITYDLRHAGMWGGTNKDGLIDCRSTNKCLTSSIAGEVVPVDFSGDCAAGWHYDLSRPVFATDGSNPYGLTCIPGSEKYQAGTDVLEIHYADSNPPIGGLLSGQTYVRSNFINGRIFVGGTPPILDFYDTNAMTQNYELHAYAYYISDHTDALSDGIPSLRRVSLVKSPTLQNQVLISGVVDLQVQFGIDVDADATIDRYVNPADMSVDDWANVYAAKIWLLMRADEQQLTTAVNTSKTFEIAGSSVIKNGTDGFRYFMVTSVVNLRNLVKL